ncbi:MAG: TerB family tellurite resistance protein [Nitrospinaceae bacterium]
MTRFQSLTLLKVLAALAWADGEITNAEENVLKRLYRKLHLSPDDLAELRPYLRAPVSRREQDVLLKALSAEMGSPKKRREILSVLEEMAHADGHLRDPEKAFMEKFAELLGKSGLTRRSFGRVRNLFQRTLFKPVRERNPERIQYFKDQVFRRIEVLTGKDLAKVCPDQERLYFLCLLGTLLASVATVDDRLDAGEKKALREVLSRRYDLEPGQWRFLFQVVEEQAQAGFDLEEAVREFTRITTYNDRLQCVQGFFAVAAADGDLAHEEVEHIRLITKGLRIPHRVFIEHKVAALDRLGRD